MVAGPDRLDPLCAEAFQALLSCAGQEPKLRTELVSPAPGERHVTWRNSRRMQDAADPLSSPRLAETNWVWLAERTDGIAVELVPDSGSADSRIGQLFAEVHPRPCDPGFARQLEPEVADAVVIEEFPCDWDGSRQAALLAECFRILRPGGYVVFSAGNASWYHRWTRRPGTKSLRRSPALSARATRGRLIDAGFTEVRVYLGDGTPRALKAIIPSNMPALWHVTRIKGLWNARRVMRWVLARAGLGSLSFRSMLVFGYK